MPCHAIESLDDPRIAPYRHLKRTNATRWTRQFIAEGEKLVRRLIDSRLPVLSLLLGHKYASAFEPLVPADVPIYCVPDSAIEQIIGFNFHRGVLACGRRPDNPALEDLIGGLGREAVLLVCPEVHDPENLGTLLRTGLAFGVAAVLLGAHSADPFSRRVLRTSMGASFRLPTVRPAPLVDALRKLRAEFHFELLAAVTSRHAAALDSVHPGPRTALLLGSEGHGLSPEWIALCDRQVTIPMIPSADSLNVGVAGGILLHHFNRAKSLL